MSKHEFLSKELRSAFQHPHIPGTVYLEARFAGKDDVSSLYHVLHTLSCVLVQTLTAVPQDDHLSSLIVRDIVDSRQPMGSLRSPGEWVKIRRGLYRDDVGVVVDSFERWGNREGSNVALVPHLSAVKSAAPKCKKSAIKLRPPPRLFDPESCVQELLCKTLTGYTYDQFTFEDGLIIKTFHSSSLESAQTIPPDLLPLLRQSLHPLVRSSAMPLPNQWHFEVGEQVWVTPPNSTQLILASILETDAAQGFSGKSLYVVETDEGQQLFTPFSLLKAVKLGDFMEILGGEHTGKAGFVVSRNESLLSIASGRFEVEPVSTFSSHILSIC